MHVPAQSGRKHKEPMASSCAFCSFQAPNQLDDLYPAVGRGSVLLSPLIEMLVPSGNSVTDTCREMFTPGTPDPSIDPSINHHRALREQIAAMSHGDRDTH